MFCLTATWTNAVDISEKYCTATPYDKTEVSRVEVLVMTMNWHCQYPNIVNTLTCHSVLRKTYWVLKGGTLKDRLNGAVWPVKEYLKPTSSSLLTVPML